ncbi:unnamed protein product [Sphagnum troendelagicum]|uniref:Uncharacterized protein n=1 Tax=Sphagnum troendelagicum TaxID=128251 RepID=A0ABP0TE49_9BRYO
MGLEFKPLLPWEGEDHDRYPSEHFCEKQKQRRRAEEEAAAAAAAASSSSSFSTQQQRRSSNSSNVSGISMSRRRGERDFNLLVSESGVSSSSRRREEQELAEAALAVVNHQKLEYAMLVASSSEEEDNVVNPEYKSFFSIVLDYPQILGQGETKEYAMRQATHLMHFAFGSMLLKGESIPPPTSGSVLEGKKAVVERDWAIVKLENFSLEMAALQFQPGIDYSAPPPDSDGEYDSDPEDEELFELEGSMNSPEERMNTSEDMFDADDSMKS